VTYLDCLLAGYEAGLGAPATAPLGEVRAKLAVAEGPFARGCTLGMIAAALVRADARAAADDLEPLPHATASP
jgi:hypothetical protein